MMGWDNLETLLYFSRMIHFFYFWLEHWRGIVEVLLGSFSCVLSSFSLRGVSTARLPEAVVISDLPKRKHCPTSRGVIIARPLKAPVTLDLLKLDLLPKLHIRSTWFILNRSKGFNHEYFIKSFHPLFSDQNKGWSHSPVLNRLRHWFGVSQVNLTLFLSEQPFSTCYFTVFLLWNCYFT